MRWHFGPGLIIANFLNLVSDIAGDLESEGILRQSRWVMRTNQVGLANSHRDHKTTIDWISSSLLAGEPLKVLVFQASTARVFAHVL